MEIKDILFEDEQVLWTHLNEIDLYKKLITNIFLAILGLLVMTLISLIIGIFVNQLQAYFFGLFWIGLIFSGYILFQYRKNTLLKKKIDLNNEDLKAYPEAFYFTNKRCILKSYKTFNLELKKFPNHEIQNDYFILKHEQIKTIIVSSYKNLQNLWISEKNSEKTIEWDSFIQFQIPNDKFKKFFEIMSNFLPLKVVDDSIENVIRYRILVEQPKNNII